MTFDNLLTLTAIEQRTGKNGIYTLITVLMDNGKTADFVYKGIKPLDFTSFSKMKKYKFMFEVYFGKFTGINIMEIQAV